MSQKKYISLTRLSDFLNKLSTKFASLIHTHKLSDITDYKVDDALSNTSTNPVQNKVIDAEFDAIATAMNALDTAIDTKANAEHTHDDRYYTETEIDNKLSGKSDTTHNHDSAYDTKGSANSALSTAKAYTDTKTSGLASTTVVDNKISAHNTSTSAHNDIRDLISGLTTRLNALADSDDTTLDQMSEIVAYIKANKSLIDSITTSKVNVSDIINNLTTNVSNKPLSAAQGVAIKSLIDELQLALNSIPQSDWNQSDETQLDYIKNKTHWSKSELITIVDTVATLNSTNGEHHTDIYYDMKIGDSYTVIYDGNTYECIAFNDAGFVTIGSSYQNYSNYPFCIFNNNDDSIVICTSTTGSHTVKITRITETVQKLDEKYIPDAIARVTDVDAAIEELITVEDIDRICGVTT